MRIRVAYLRRSLTQELLTSSDIPAAMELSFADFVRADRKNKQVQIGPVVYCGKLRMVICGTCGRQPWKDVGTPFGPPNRSAGNIGAVSVRGEKYWIGAINERDQARTLKSAAFRKFFRYKNVTQPQLESRTAAHHER